MEKQELEQLSMMIIMYAGTSKADSEEAMDLALEGKFEEAEKMIASADENLRLSNLEHYKALQVDSQEGLNMNLLFIHAEDQMMGADTIMSIAKKFILLAKEIKK